MAPDLGTKHSCFNCGTRFYDLRKPDPICPKCGADQRQTPTRPTASTGEKRRSRAAPASEVEVTAEDGPIPEADDEDEEEDDDEDADEEL